MSLLSPHLHRGGEALSHQVKLCECGCGQPTGPARRTERSRGWIKGEPTRFLDGHHVGSRHGRPEEFREAREMAAEGVPRSAISRWTGVEKSTLSGWLVGVVVVRGARPRSRIAYDSHNECWRIYVYDHCPQTDDRQATIDYWPLEWLHFATREVAEAHLAIHGEYGVTA
jgi:hypothetical protein